MTPQELEKHGLRVAPLVFIDEDGDGTVFTSRVGGLMRIFLQKGGNFFVPKLGMDTYPSLPEAIAAANADHAARIAAALEPISATDLIAEDAALFGEDLLEPIAQPVSVAEAARK